MRKLIIALFFTLQAVALSAQSGIVIRGTVKDAAGGPVPGAAVMVAGMQSVGVVTDVNGAYSISVPASAAGKAELVFSCMTYKSVTEKVGSRSVIDVVLEEDRELLDEVVVVGYGSMRRSDLTGSVSSVKIDEDLAARSTTFDQMLQGHASGVEVISSSEAPDAGVSLRIRGITSLNGSSEPLYVVDGIILTTAGSGSTGVDADEEMNSLMGINPQDIASIEILKDASATAIYGAAGANGVVLITTKAANREKPTITFNAGVDINTPYKTLDVLDFDKFIEYVKWRESAGDGYATTTLGYIYENYGKPDQQLKDIRIKDWQKEYIRNSVNQRYYFSISGKPKTMSYLFSIGYNKNEGIVVNTSSEQFTARLNVQKTFGKRLTVGIKSNFARVNSSKMQGAGSGDNGTSTSFMKALQYYRPFVNVIPVEDEDDYDETEDSYTASSPTKWVKDASCGRTAFRVTPSVFASVKILDYLTFKTTFGGDYHRQEYNKFKGITVSNSTASGGESNSETYSWNWDNVLTFDKAFRRHHLTATGGFTMNRYHNNAFGNNSTNIIQYSTGIDNINSASVSTMTFSEVQTSKMSFFVRALYNYADRYVLTATYRLDGSSLFAAGNRFSHFPSVAAAWRINKEPWFNVPVISMMKFRLGWGLVGNCSVKPYQIMATEGSTKYGYHFNEAQYQTVLKPDTFANEGLRWETTSQWNAGLDYGMWGGRLTFSVDAYYKNTYDLLQQRKVTYNTGFASVWVNQGSIENKGIEISLEAAPLSGKDFEWTLGGNISFNRNKLTDIGFDATEADFYFEPGVKSKERFYTGGSVAGAQSLASAPLNVFMLGRPIGLLYGYRTDGLVKEGSFGVPVTEQNYSAGVYPTPGSINYVDMNGNGYIDPEDRTVIGNANPIFTYGFSTSISFRKFRLSANFNGSFGNQIYNANTMALTNTHFYGSVRNVLSDAWLNAWTPENPFAQYVANGAASRYGQDFTGVFTTNELPYSTDRDVEDASYLRLSNLSLSYTLNLPKTSPLRRIVFGVSANNLLILTKYSGYSPIVSSYSIASQRIGIDSGGYPSTRSFCFDLKFTF